MVILITSLINWHSLYSESSIRTNLYRKNYDHDQEINKKLRNDSCEIHLNNEDNVKTKS